MEYERNCNIIGIFWELFYTFVYSIDIDIYIYRFWQIGFGYIEKEVEGNLLLEL